MISQRIHYWWARNLLIAREIGYNLGLIEWVDSRAEIGEMPCSGEAQREFLIVRSRDLSRRIFFLGDFGA